MSLPIIAIVGRPNVGKSRLFNRLTGRYTALVDATAGVTRDRHYGYADWRGRNFIVVDTGGLIPGSENPLNQKIWGQAFQAIQEADCIVCVFDGIEGLTVADEVLVEKLRPVTKPILYVINKIDHASLEKNIYEFSRLGVDPLISVSAEHGRTVSDLLEKIFEKIEPLEKGKKEEKKGLRLSLVGRPNVGKSTLINRLAMEERVIVHEEAGTTRDAIDVAIEREGRQYIFVDTAGVKKKSATKTRLEKFSVMTTLKAIDQSQMVLLLLDATQGPTHQDLHLAYHIWSGAKGLLLLVNKWDLMKGSPEKYLEGLRYELGELQNIPILTLSAKTGRGCGAIWKSIVSIAENLEKKIETAKLNKWLEEVTGATPPPSYKGRDVRLYYATQVRSNPIHFVFFVNEPKGIPVAYQRFLKHQLTKTFGLEGAPVILSFRPRKNR